MKTLILAALALTLALAGCASTGDMSGNGAEHTFPAGSDSQFE